MTTLRLDWEQPDHMGRAGWEALLSRCPRANPFQSWSWGDAHADAHGHTPRRAVVRAQDRPIGLLQLVERRYLGVLTFAQLIRGPVFTGGAETAMALPQVLRDLRRLYRPTRGAVLALTPELDAGPVADRFLKDAGFVQVKTGYRSAWLELTRSEKTLHRELRQNFRNQLRRAEGAGLTVAAGDEAARERLVARHAEHRRRRRYTGPAPAVLTGLPMAETPTLVARDAAGTELAAVMLLRHGATATYQVGWASEDGRSRNATNLLLWRAILDLKADGATRLDLGGLDDADAAGAAHFKAGLGGAPFTLAGTFV